jgi:hypothetical protein
MALNAPVHHPPKTLGESAVCFASVVVLLMAAAIGLQWVLHLLPW